MPNTRALLLATVPGTILHVAMVLTGHVHKSITGLFVGGMGFSLLAGLAYAAWSREGSSASRALGGMIAGALSALIGIFVSYQLGDVPASLLALGTISSALTGALGGWLGKFFFPRAGAVAMLAILVSVPENAGGQTTTGHSTVPDTTPIVAEAVIDAPAEAVWNAWASAARLRAWLAPQAEIDLRVGGLMRTNYSAHGSLGDSKTIENTILSLDPTRMLSIRISKVPAGFPFANAAPHMWTVVYFEPVTPDRTEVRVVGPGFRSDA